MRQVAHPRAAQAAPLECAFMPDIQSMPRSRRAIAAESLSVSPRVAGEMLDYGETKIKALIKSRELESYVDGGSRRILTQSIHNYIARKVEATEAPARRGPSRPRKADKS